jgi:hypothetical protein
MANRSDLLSAAKKNGFKVTEFPSGLIEFSNLKLASTFYLVDDSSKAYENAIGIIEKSIHECECSALADKMLYSSKIRINRGEWMASELPARVAHDEVYYGEVFIGAIQCVKSGIASRMESSTFSQNGSGILGRDICWLIYQALLDGLIKEN